MMRTRLGGLFVFFQSRHGKLANSFDMYSRHWELLLSDQ